MNTSLTVCFVEDDAGFLKLLQRRLKGIFQDFSVTHFPTLAKAREALKSSDEFDLIFLDQHLPDGQGVSLLSEGFFKERAVIAMSADVNPEMAGANMKAGATYFLPKQSIMEPLFEPLIRGILERNQLQQEAITARIVEAQLETVRTLVSTLRHEVNNPLGAVLGATYILKANETLTSDQRDAVSLVEASGQRIKHVLEELCQTVSLEAVTKGRQKVFHVPGDKPWE